MKIKNPWNKGKKTGPLSDLHKEKIGKSNKGKTRTQETKDKIGNSRKNKKHTEESNQKNRDKHLGKKASEETKKLMSIAHKGQIPWNKGLKTPNNIKKYFNKYTSRYKSF